MPIYLKRLPAIIAVALCLTTAMMAQSPAGWMLETTVRDLHAVSDTFEDENEKRQIENILGMLRTPEYQTGGTL